MLQEDKEWFVDWFNSPYYHILYKSRDEKEARDFINDLSSCLSFHPNHNILDLACGKGRHAIYLNNLGYNVTGLDLSIENIQFAKSFENSRLKFHVHDMREEYPKEKFDFVLNLFTSFGYFNNTEENKKVLQSVYKMLNWDGVLVIDFFNCTKVLNTLIPEEVKHIDGIDFTITKKLENGLILKTIAFSDLGKQFSFQEKVQALSLETFVSLLNETGFTVSNTFGDYKLSSFNKQESNRLILVAKKNPKL